MGIFGSSSGPVIKGFSSSFGEYRDFEGGGGMGGGALESDSVRTTQNNGRIWQQFWSCHQRFFKQLC